jgi:hypothetical protein
MNGLASAVRLVSGIGALLIQENGVRVGKEAREDELDFLAGKTVVEIRDGGRIVFEAGTNPEPRLYADTGTSVCTDSKARPLPLQSLVGRMVTSASASEGVLSLAFADGATFRCAPSQEYEAWQVVGSFVVVCCPGGGLIVWDDTPPIPLGQLRERDPAAAAALERMLERFNLPRPTGFPPADGEES